VPTYEYECRDCGRRLEKFQQMSAAPLRKCPECGGRLKRLIGAGAGVIVKGAGGDRCPDSGGMCDRTTPCCGLDEPCARSPLGR